MKRKKPSRKEGSKQWKDCMSMITLILSIRSEIHLQNCSCLRSSSKGYRTDEYNQEVLMNYEEIRERWGQYFKWLMNDENT